jgi:peptidoglycan/LPS O-acetylase OafA/YrhL
LPVELGTFLLGSLGYYFYAYARQRKWHIRQLGWIAWPFMVLTIFLIAYPQRLSGARPAMLFSLMAVCVPFVFALTKSWRIDRWIGELSYPIYIVHVVAGAVLAKVVNAQGLDDVKGWQLLLATVPLAIFIRICIEDPIDRWRQRMHERKLKSEAPMEPAPF